MTEFDVRSIEWKDGEVRFLDQTLLPAQERIIATKDPAVVAAAIRTLAIRGAPLIGIAAAYGVALAFRNELPGNPRSHLARVCDLFASTRPTAVNLFWALDRMKRRASAFPDFAEGLAEALLDEAVKIHEEDRQMCLEIGRHGAEILGPGSSVLTHCNTGLLATGGIGTALGILRTAWERRTLKHVYIGETRPLHQGARLTAWELKKLGIPATLITDGTAAFLMQQGKISAVVVGADRIAANGDVANKVGTYALAVAAKHHKQPFYVAAPSSTLDLQTRSGKDIEIELRSAEEIVRQGDKQIAPDGVDVYAPAFDITPAELITAMITEQGPIHPPFRSSLNGLRYSAHGVAL